MKQHFDWLMGQEVKADHPITCLNPDGTFKIVDAQIDGGKLYVRGDDTMWFSSEMISLANKNP